MPARDLQTFLDDVHRLKELFGSKWTSAILIALAEGPIRRAELLATVNSYSASHLHDSILSRELRRLLTNGLVQRTRTEASFPPKVYYGLTPKAVQLLQLAVNSHDELPTWSTARN